MSKLFILGTGFSRAVSESVKMPTLKELGEHVKTEINRLPGHEVYEGLISDPSNVELLLTYLYQDAPWKTASQSYLEKSAFLEISQIIADYITKCERQIFEAKSVLHDWTKDFILYLVKEKATVATFNYDKIFECLSLIHLKDKEYDLLSMYDIPLTPLNNRTKEIGPAYFSTELNDYPYKLLKLHGSINWYYSGDMTLATQQVYYSPDYINLMIREDVSWTDYDERMKTLERNKSDLVSLIIPPVAEKNLFYGIALVKALWRNFYKAAMDADEIYCIGYSLPITDLTTSIFFSNVINKPNKTVYIVNLDDLEEHYKKVLPNCVIKRDYISNNEPIKQLVEYLTANNP